MPEKGTSTLRMRVCRQCGIEFMGGPRAWYCPTCRIERQREQGRTCKQRQRKGQTRRLGSIDKCEVCGKDYIVNSARQRYCPDCAPERYREVDREQSRGWLDGFWTAESATAENVYNNFYDEGDDAQGVYEPWIAEITEDEFKKFPCIFPKEWAYGGEAE